MSPNFKAFIELQDELEKEFGAKVDLVTLHNNMRKRFLETIEIVQKRTKSVSTTDDFTIDDDALILFDSVLMRL